MANGLPSWDDTSPVQEEAKPVQPTGGEKLPSWEDTTPTQLPSWEATTDLSPTAKRAEEIRAELKNYGLGDLLRPSAVEARGSLLTSRSVPKADVEALAVDNGLTPDQVALVKELAPLWVAAPPVGEMSAKDAIYTVLGRAGYALADIPQFVAKKTLDSLSDPKVRETLDDLKELGEGRMGAAEWAGWNFGPALATKAVRGALGAVVKEVPRSLPKAAAIGAAEGAAQGLGSSREGAEIESAVQGAALGGAIGPAAAVAGKLFTKMFGKKVVAEGVDADLAAGEKVASTADDQLQLDYQRNNEADLTKIGNEAYASVKESEDILEKFAFDKTPLTAKDAEIIIEQQMTPESITLAKRKVASALDKKQSEVTDLEVANSFAQSKYESWLQDFVARDPSLKTKVDVKDSVPFRRAATNDEIFEAIQSRGSDYLRQDWRDTSLVDITQSAAKQQGVRFRADDAPLGKTVVNAVGDRQFGFKVADERSGADTLKDFYAANTNSNKLTVEKDRFFRGEGGIKEIYKSAKKVKGIISDLVSDDGQIYKAITTRNLNILPAEWRGTAESIIKFFDRVKERANTIRGDDISPLAIRTREDFGLPQKLVRPVDYLIKMRAKFETMKDILPNVSKSDLFAARKGDQLAEGTKLSPEQFSQLRDFVRGINIVNPPTEIKDVPSLLKAYKDVTERGGSGVKLHSVASTTMERTDAIPEFLREKNIFRLMDRYTTDTMRNVYLRQPLERLLKKASLMEKTGEGNLDVEARFIRRYVADQLGIRTISMARLGQEVRLAFANGLDKVLTPVIKDPARREKAIKLVASFPEAMASLQYNIYPNVLGLNIRAHIAQLTQPLFKTAPELGGAYGYDVVSRSYFTTTMQLMQQIKSGAADAVGVNILPPDVFAKLKSMGLEPKAVVREHIDAVEEGIQLRNGFSKANRAMADYVMKSYGSMDSLNRAATLNVAERVVADLNNNVSGAVKAVSRMPLAVRRQVIAAKGNPAEQIRAIAVHLNSATQYNYSRAALSELGAIVGPFLSAFTKWPLATAGDIAADIRTKGIGKGSARILEKYGAVWAMAQLADSILYAAVTGDAEMFPDWKEAGPRWQKILGRSGFSGMSPIESISPVVGMVVPSKERESLVKSPLIEALYEDLIKPVMEEDEGKTRKGFTKLASTYVPGGFIYTLMNKTAPAVFNDETEW